MINIFGKKTILFLLLVFTTSILVGCGVGFIANSVNTLKKEDAQKFTVDKTKVEAITKIDINTRIADVELIEADDYYVEIDYMYWEESPEYTLEDGVLRFDDSNVLPKSYSINFELKNSIKIYIPNAAAFDQIKMNNSTGNITAAGFVADDLNVNVAYGDLVIKNAAAVKCAIRLSAGNSKITDFSVAEMDFINSYGNAKFTNINTNASQLPDGVDFNNFDVSMSSGNIDIKGLNSISTDISNSYGNVNCDEITCEKFDTSLSSGDLNISKADLKDITIDNSYGDVTLSLSMAKEDYTMDLNTSYGEIEVDGKSYENHLVFESGGTRNIDVTLSSGDVSIEFE